MNLLNSFRTSDSSRKITTYIYKNSSYECAFDFGSNDIPSIDVKNLDYIFITHEHSDHFMGLYNVEYAEILLKNNCHIYASNVTKDLILAIFENSIKVSLDRREIVTIRKLLEKIEGVLFFEKYALNKNSYFKFFPSGHTYGSSMIYLNDSECKILYTGDIDYSNDDSDRQYNLDLDIDETVDYLIADGTYLDSKNFKDEDVNAIRENIIERGHNNFLCKTEKILFFSKKLMLSSKLKDKYFVGLSSEIKWYLEILKKYNYDPFVTDVIVLKSNVYEPPENRAEILVTSKINSKQTNVNGLVGLHISFIDFANFIQQFDPAKTKILIGHYNTGKQNAILKTFGSNNLTYEYDVKVLETGEISL